ncbi:hypothetical protein Acy02nite_91390 [Actinoplanes cyaneus]|uniref:Uncharacterized protein n=1 Tax=Actinoplanes cyaneus TaxID=52696 RepID=A0A919MB66_9ACTN|nr:hypothetical protein Acy02nite_91390 [Actinoplanes cyaneus]
MYISGINLSDAANNPGTVAAYGTLLCTAAYTSAQAGNASNADTYLTEAVAAARLLGDHHSVGLHPLTPTTVAMYRISVHTTLGDTGTALKHAASVNPAQLPTAERHSRYLVDTARAWHRHGRPDGPLTRCWPRNAAPRKTWPGPACGTWSRPCSTRRHPPRPHCVASPAGSLSARAGDRAFSAGADSRAPDIRLSTGVTSLAGGDAD